MGILKKIVSFTLTASILIGSAYGGIKIYKANNVKAAPVVSVGEIKEYDYYTDSSSVTLDGTITTNVTQKVVIDDDIVVNDIYVGEGQPVKKGEKLASFDTTLVEMKLKIANMNRQLYENRLKKSQERLNSLKNGGPVKEEDAGLSVSGNAYMGLSMSGIYFAEAVISAINPETNEEELIKNIESAENELEEAREYYHNSSEVYALGSDILSDGSEEEEFGPFFSSFDEFRNPYSGNGTKEDPYVFLCKNDMGYVTIKGTLLNKLGGFTDGIKQSEGSYAVFEFHQDNLINPENRKLSCIGYYLFDGTGLSEPFDTDSVMTLNLSDTKRYEDDPDESEPSIITPAPESEQTDIYESESTEPLINESETTDPGLISSDVNDDITSYDKIIVPETTYNTDSDELNDGGAVFYKTLDSESSPFVGTGSKDDPYVFLADNTDKKVILKGSFYNMLAGFNTDGERVANPCYFVIEFYENNTITDYSNRKLSCIGYYLLDGNTITEARDPESETTLLLEETQKYSPDLDIGYGYLDYSDYDTDNLEITREDAIRYQEMNIKSLELSLRSSDIEIRKLQKQAELKEICADIDGTVVSVKQPGTKTSGYDDSFIRIKSKEGFYLQGNVSELMLDDMKPGTKLSCSGYTSGTFYATVTSISEYPTQSTDNSMYFYNNMNPNASSYTYTAEIEDQTLEFSQDDWITVTLMKDSSANDDIIIPISYVRTDDGNYYVMKDDNGHLKKQYVKTGGLANDGYSIYVKGGLSDGDMIAFPYAKNSVEGAVTEHVSVKEMNG